MGDSPERSVAEAQYFASETFPVSEEASKELARPAWPGAYAVIATILLLVLLTSFFLDIGFKFPF